MRSVRKKHPGAGEVDSNSNSEKGAAVSDTWHDHVHMQPVRSKITCSHIYYSSSRCFSAGSGPFIDHTGVDATTHGHLLDLLASIQPLATYRGNVVPFLHKYLISQWRIYSPQGCPLQKKISSDVKEILMIVYHDIRHPPFTE